jgi:hypothetical protein
MPAFPPPGQLPIPTMDVMVFVWAGPLRRWWPYQRRFAGAETEANGHRNRPLGDESQDAENAAPNLDRSALNFKSLSRASGSRW